jgi:hypothetical protein
MQTRCADTVHDIRRFICALHIDTPWARSCVGVPSRPFMASSAVRSCVVISLVAKFGVSNVVATSRSHPAEERILQETCQDTELLRAFASEPTSTCRTLAVQLARSLCGVHLIIRSQFRYAAQCRMSLNIVDCHIPELVTLMPGTHPNLKQFHSL